MEPVRTNKAFKDLQDEWYQRLESENFLDIENTKHPHRPLIEWHSFKMTSEKFQIIKEIKSQYQLQIDSFHNHESFPEACKLIVKHGNCKFTYNEVGIIWALHVDGLTIRKIASDLNRSKSTIHYVIQGLRQWMNLI